MKKFTRISLYVIALAMVAVYFVPVWEITLEAPQYPEGLGFEIWINKMTGDLNTVNGLNHYIGMKKIEPDSIKELTYMPYFLGFLLITLLFTAWKNKKSLLMVWVAVFIVFGIAGGIDFYVWEYDYGHNLDTTAAIRVPGMTYQPPLIGDKQLLNFVAHSYPSYGGFILIISGILSVLLLFYELKFNKYEK
jgi:copper chaperone NosL